MINFHQMKPKIIFDDSEFFVIDKPSGWITNDSGTTTNQPVIQTWIRNNFEYPLKGDREFRDGVVHRLDKETSGILLIAKTKDSFENLQNQFKERKTQKKYIGLVHGELLQNEGEINAPVGRLPWRRDRFGVLPGGRSAVTFFKVIGKYQSQSGNEKYTLVEFSPKTGRTHQIRIHAKYINHPLVGDSFYAGRKTARNDRKWCVRLFLHALGISFFHPKKGKGVEFKTDMPQDLESSLHKLQNILI